MNGFLKRLWIQSLVVFCLTAATVVDWNAAFAGSQIDSDDIIKNVRKKFKDVDSFVIDFDYRFYWRLTKQTQKMGGKILYKKKNKIRFELGQQLDITDGSTVWQYSDANKQVIIEHLDKNDKSLFLPNYFLYDYLDKYKSELIKQEAVLGQNCFVLKMIPKTSDDIIQSMKIWVGEKDWITHRMEYTDLEGNVISYDFVDIKLGAVLADNLFSFEFGSDVEVIDLR